MQELQGHAQRGYKKIERALDQMECLANLISSPSLRKPLKGTKVLGCVSFTPETGAFIMLLDQLGADIRWCSDGPVCSDPDVMEYLRSEDIKIFGDAIMTPKEWEQSLKDAAKFKKLDNNLIVVDDGSVMTQYLIDEKHKALDHTILISEQTASGITKLAKAYQEDKVPCPAHNVDGSRVKRLENYYGVRESILGAFSNVTDSHIAGNTVAVWGYGHVGSGLANLLRDYGAEVFVLDASIEKLVDAVYAGHRVVDKNKALQRAKVHITATGRNDIIKGEDLLMAKSGAILCNAGHGNQEYDYDWLAKNSETEAVNEFVERHALQNGAHLFSTCKGHLLNFGPKSGCSPKMMSLTFGVHAIGLLHFLQHREDYKENKLYDIPQAVNNTVLSLEHTETEKKRIKSDALQSDFTNLDIGVHAE